MNDDYFINPNEDPFNGYGIDSTGTIVSSRSNGSGYSMPSQGQGTSIGNIGVSSRGEAASLNATDDGIAGELGDTQSKP